MKRIGLILFGIAILLPARATIPSSPAPAPQNGLVQTGSSLNKILLHGSPDSLYGKCQRETAGNRLFSSLCREFVEQLQRKINLMVVESEIQIQAERLRGPARDADRRERGILLQRLNLAATRAEESIRTLKAAYSDRSFREHLPEILPDAQKVRDIFEAYARLSPDGKI